MPVVDWSLWAWLGWAAYFLVVEIIAIRRSARGDTLSEHVWAWLGANARGAHRPPTFWAWLRRLVILLFLTWLVVHLVTGGWV